MSKAANTGNGFPSGMKNRIINGGMDISQRGTSFTPANPGNIYCLDRWICGNTNDAVVTAAQSSDVPPNLEFQNSFKATVTTADTSIAAGQYSTLSQQIEGYNVRDLIGRTFTLSFWVKSSKIGIHSVGFKNAGPDRSYIVEYTVNSTNTWEYKTVTVSGGLITAGTWDWTNGRGLVVTFTLMAGTNFQTSSGSWNTGNLLATANQVNCLDTIGNIFAITGVQLELGPVATPFEHRLYGMELALCQRYYQQYGGNSVNERIGISFNFSTTQTRLAIPLGTNMRATPTLISVSNFSDWTIETLNGVFAIISNIVVDQSSSKFFCINCTTGTAITAGQASQVMANSITARLGITAEL